MKVLQVQSCAEPASRMSAAALADIEALRASERLQGIFASAPRPAPGRGQRAPGLGAVPTEAGGTERRVLVGSRRARAGVGLIAAILGIGVLAIGVTGLREDMARVAPVAEFLVQAVGGAPDAEVAGGQAPQTPRTAETRQHAAGAEVSGVPATAGPLRAEAPQPVPSKSADDLAKSMDLAAIIRERVVAARTAHLRDVPGVESPGVAREPAVPLTVPQPTWAPQAAAPVSAPAPRRQAQSTAPPVRSPAPPLEAVETIPQPRADTGPAETGPAG